MPFILYDYKLTKNGLKKKTPAFRKLYSESPDIPLLMAKLETLKIVAINLTGGKREFLKK
jgi:hypothetical protein